MVQIAFEKVEERNIIYLGDILFENSDYRESVDDGLDFSSHLSDHVRLHIDLSTIPEVELDNPRVKGEEKKEMIDDSSSEKFNKTEEDLDNELKNYFNQ